MCNFRSITLTKCLLKIYKKQSLFKNTFEFGCNFNLREIFDKIVQDLNLIKKEHINLRNPNLFLRYMYLVLTIKTCRSM